ncbi:MAG TPA: hypothetical protein VLG68_10790 [Gammaproteobacteria bacterium]|nr:hypothetical protein [Gammaproteobacteria bacterium]
MNMPDMEDNIAKRARELFLASLGQLDGAVLARLREARLRAVEAASQPRPFWRPQSLGLPLGAVALLFVVLVGGGLWWNSLTPPPAAEPFASGNNDDLPIVLNSDNLDMYSDLDFYQWLETQDQAPAPASDEDDPSDDDDDSDEGG